MKKSSILIFCGVYYFTVLVYTKTTIHLSVGGYSLRRSKYFPVSDWLAAPVDQIWKEHFFPTKLRYTLLTRTFVCLAQGLWFILITQLTPILPFARPNLPDAELHPSRLSHTSISGCRPVVQR